MSENREAAINVNNSVLSEGNYWMKPTEASPQELPDKTTSCMDYASKREK